MDGLKTVLSYPENSRSIIAFISCAKYSFKAKCVLVRYRHGYVFLTFSVSEIEKGISQLKTTKETVTFFQAFIYCLVFC